jgi:hypothetical protein
MKKNGRGIGRGIWGVIGSGKGRGIDIGIVGEEQRNSRGIVDE